MLNDPLCGKIHGISCESNPFRLLIRSNENISSAVVNNNEQLHHNIFLFQRLHQQVRSLIRPWFISEVDWSQRVRYRDRYTVKRREAPGTAASFYTGYISRACSCTFLWLHRNRHYTMEHLCSHLWKWTLVSIVLSSYSLMITVWTSKYSIKKKNSLNRHAGLTKRIQKIILEVSKNEPRIYFEKENHCSMQFAWMMKCCLMKHVHTKIQVSWGKRQRINLGIKTTYTFE